MDENTTTTPPILPPSVPVWDAAMIRHSIISIAIGAAISILSIAFQALLQWLQHYSVQVNGSVAGIVSYLWQLKSNRLT